MKNLPQPAPLASEDDERGLISCILQAPAETLTLTRKSGITTRCFRNLQYREIYAVALDLHQQGKAVNAITVSQHLEGQQWFQVAGGRAFALNLADACPSAANAPYFIPPLLDNPKAEALLELCDTVVKMKQRGMASAEIFTEAMAILTNAQAHFLADELPAIVSASQLITNKPPTPPELIHGVLHQGGKLMLGGASKSQKTWGLLDLGLSVAHDVAWWQFRTTPGKVLFVNLEVQPWAFASRIDAVASAKHIRVSDDTLHVWILRGHSAPFDVLLPKIIQRTKSEGYSLVILDPIYKLYGGTDENSAGDVANLLNGIERITTETGYRRTHSLISWSVGDLAPAFTNAA